MSNTIDDNFYHRADEHINLSNTQLQTETRGRVSASMMYSLARFNAWISASGFNTRKEMSIAKEETINYFVKEYRAMLEENLDDYINNFDEYMK